MDLTSYRMTNGKLASHTSLGSYPLIYLDRACEVFCAACANASKSIIDVDVHWEGPAFYCVECNETIESAYGDPDAPSCDLNSRRLRDGSGEEETP